MTDYYSNYPEVDHLTTTTSKVIRALSIMFAHDGIPDELISDNGPQFASGDLHNLSKIGTLPTRRPLHAQSKGKAENTVKSVKKLFWKAKESGISEAQDLLDFRNTPTEGIGSSAAQRLFG